jgi:hypothetical protein
MAGRPGLFGGIRQSDAADRDADGGFGPNDPLANSPMVRLGDPATPFQGSGFASAPAFGGTPGFDPIWGTLGAPGAQGNDPWRTNSPAAEPSGLAVDVEIFGDGFQISGQLHTGQFERLSDWLNMQSGFITVHNGMHLELGRGNATDPDQTRGTLWVRLDQIVMVAEHANIQQARPGAPVVQKQRRKVSIVTPGYSLRGSLHIHAHGSMQQFLESPDPHFLAITELSVRWRSDAMLVSRFPFALVNRHQMVTILDEPATPAGGAAQGPDESTNEESEPLHRRWGAA